MSAPKNSPGSADPFLNEPHRQNQSGTREIVRNGNFERDIKGALGLLRAHARDNEVQVAILSLFRALGIERANIGVHHYVPPLQREETLSIPPPPPTYPGADVLTLDLDEDTRPERR